MVTIQYKQTSHMTIEKKGNKSSKMEEVATFGVSLDLKVTNSGYDITYFEMRCELSHLIEFGRFGGLISVVEKASCV